MSEWEAGPALDAEIARRVFGCAAILARRGKGVLMAACQCVATNHGSEPFGVLPYYSRDIAAAWPVGEAMVEQVGWGTVRSDMEDARGAGTVWVVCFGTEAAECAAPTAPLAICRAALAALEDTP